MVTDPIYHTFFGLKEKPFNLTPDPKFLFLTDKHQEALDHLIFGLEQKSGFILLLGEVGAGKTTVCRSLLEKLDDRYITALILHPFLAEENLLATILRDLNQTPGGATKRELLEELNQFILARRLEGKNIVLLFDESQNLSPEALEQIRILSNLETDKDKLLQIILIGQKELENKLNRPELRQLNQRIGVRYYLPPLNKQETGRYLSYRLSVAGNDGSIRFSPRAVDAIYTYSKGIPRLINLAADRALIAGFTRETRAVNRSLARMGIRSLCSRDSDGGFPRFLKPINPLALFIIFAFLFGSIVLFWLGIQLRNGEPQTYKITLAIPAASTRE
jgi:general secretion pathway protein A